MSKYLSILILVLLGNNLHTLFAQESEDFGMVEKELITKEVLMILDDYKKYGTLTQTFTYISKEYTDKFRQLFEPNAKVLNDIQSPENEEEYLTIETYLSVIQKWYPEGLAIEYVNFLDETKHIGDPYRYEDRFAVRVNLDKKIDGLTKEFDKVAKVIPITIVIAFDKDLIKFKIAEINTPQELNPEKEEVLVQATKKEEEKEDILAQVSPKKEDKSIAQKNTKKEGKPKKGVKVKKKKPSLYKPAPKKDKKLFAQKRNKQRNPRLRKSGNRAEKGWFVSFLVNPLQLNSQFQLNEDLKNIFNMKGVSITAPPISLERLRVEADYFLTERLGVGVGLGINAYKSNISISNFYYRESDVQESGSDEYADILEISGQNIVEKITYRGTEFSLMLKYKQPISTNMFIYGGIGAKFVFNNPDRPSLEVPELDYYNTYRETDRNGESTITSTGGFIPRNPAEAAFLVEYNLYSRTALDSVRNQEEAEQYKLRTEREAFLVKEMNSMLTGNLGIGYSVNKRLKLKLGLLATIGGDILNKKVLTNPDSKLGLVKVSFDNEASPDNSNISKVRNDYLSIARREGNQWNLRAVGIEIGLMFKLGSIDFF